MPDPPFFSALRYHQDNLQQLCAERPLDWSEYHHMNHFHGNHSIISRYAELDHSTPLPFSIEHAIPYDLSEPYDYDIQSGLPTFLAVHDRSAALYRQKNVPSVIPVGYSYLYALKLYQKLHPDCTPAARKGTLVFPDKSTLLMDTDFDRNEFAQRLLNLPKEYHPLAVCIYWKDYIRGTHLPFQEAGIPLVSAGHMMDPDFQLRLHDLCRHFKYSCANDLAGSFTLSVLSGCHFFHLNTGQVTQNKDGTKKTFDRDPTLDHPFKKECLAASPFPPRSKEVQVELAQVHAGLIHQKSKPELQNIFTKARDRLQNQENPLSIHFDKKVSKRHLFSLLPSGIDIDGWARKQASLHIPIPRETSAIQLVIELPEWSGLEKHYLEIAVNGILHSTLSCSYGIEEIKIPVAPGTAEKILLTFHSKYEFTMPDGNRKRSFRIHFFQLLF